MELTLHHFAMEVKSIDRSLAFYEKLGFQLQKPKTTFPEGFFAYIGSAENISLELMELSRSESLAQPGICPHIALEAKDLESAIGFLKGQGIEINDGPHLIPGEVKLLGILDPDGYRIEIVEILK